MKKLFAAVAAFVISAAAYAASFSGGGLPDPFVMGTDKNCNGSWMCNIGYQDTGGRTVRNLTINTGIRNLVLIIDGQSLMGAEAPTAYTPTNGTAIDNLNPFDGSVYAWADQPLGSTWVSSSVSGSGVGHIGARIADKFISGGQFDRVIIVPIAVGGSLIADHATGALVNNLCAAHKRIVARGFGPQTNVTEGILFGQGEADTVAGTSQANYTTAANTVIANVQACGFSGRFFINTESWSGGTTSANVTNAQAAVVNNTTVFAGGNLDTLNATNRLTDNTHLNDTGMSSAATLIYNAMHASGAPY